MSPLRASRFWTLAALLVGATATGLLACGEATLKEFAARAAPTGGPDIRFASGVMPVFVAKDCIAAACHGYGGIASGGLALGGGGSTVDDIYQELQDGGNLNGVQGSDLNFSVVTDSLLLAKPLADSPQSHGGGKQFLTDTDPGYLSIKGWIESGAPNN